MTSQQLQDIANIATIVSAIFAVLAFPVAILAWLVTREKFAEFWEKWRNLVFKGAGIVVVVSIVIFLWGIGWLSWLQASVTLPVWGLGLAVVLLLVFAGSVYLALTKYVQPARKKSPELSEKEKAGERLPEGSYLTIKQRDVRFGSRAWGGDVMPLEPVFLVTLDLINHGGQPATLSKLEVTNLNVKTALLDVRTPNFKLHKPFVSLPIHLPWVIGPGQREADIKLDIDIKFGERDVAKFAERLEELQGDYEIEIHYAYEDMDRSIYSHSITVVGSYDDFRKRILEKWREKRPDLFARAVNV